MHGLEAEYGDRVAFERLDVAQPENEQIQLRYDLRGHPTAVVLDPQGEVVARFFGVQPAADIRPALDRALENSP